MVIEGSGLPGLTCPPDAAGEHHNVHIALCTKRKDQPALVVPGKPWLAIQPVPGDAPSTRWEVPVTVRRDADGFDFSGPYVRGDRTDRNLFLAWGDVPGDGTLRLIRGSKLGFADVGPRLVEDAMRPGHRLVAGAEADLVQARSNGRSRSRVGAGKPAAAGLHPVAIGHGGQAAAGSGSRS